jgi:hypothetical protein
MRGALMRATLLAAILLPGLALAQVSPSKGGGSGGSAFPTLNVRSSTYGAKGDDTTTDTGSFQTALGAAIAQGATGGSVYVPCGNYKVTSPLIINTKVAQHLRLYGDGRCSNIDGFNQNIPLILAHPNWPPLTTAVGMDPNGEGRAGHLADDHGWIALSDLNRVTVNGLSALTVELWYKPDGTPSGAFIVGASGSKSLGSPVEQAFFIQNNSGTARARLVTTGNPAGITLNGGTLTAGHVYYIALTYDSATTRASLYVGESPGTATRVDTNASVSGTIVQPRYEDIVIGPQFQTWRFGKISGNGPHGWVSNLELNKTARWSAASITIPGSVAALDSNAVIYFSFEQPTDIGFYARDPGLDAFVYEHRDDLVDAIVDLEIDHLRFSRANTVFEGNTCINCDLHDLEWDSINTDGLVLRNNSFGSRIHGITGTGCARGSHVVITNSGLTDVIGGYLVGGYVDIFGGAYSGKVQGVYMTPATGGLYDMWLQGGGSSQSNVLVDQCAIGNETGTLSEANLGLDSLIGATVVNTQFESASAVVVPPAYILADRGDDAATSFPVTIVNATFRTGGASTAPSYKISTRGGWVSTADTGWITIVNSVGTDVSAVAVPLTDTVAAVIEDTLSQRTNQAGLSGTSTRANNLRAQCTVADASTACVWNFAVAEPNASYFAVCASSSVTGSPAADSAVILSQTKATGSDTFNLKAAPGAGTSRTFDCIMVR